MKIALVGPTYPFRGGISHYTTLLYSHLQKKHQVHLYTFNRPYPRSLYPGDSSPDQSRMEFSSKSAIPIIDWANPFSWIKCGLLISRWSPHLIIFPWWMWGWAIPFRIIAKTVTLRRKVKILFICHNVVEHEAASWKSVCAKFALSAGDFFVVHSHKDYENFKAIFPEAKVAVNFHPTYEIFRHTIMSKEQAKAKLKIHDKFRKTLLFFGIIRPYKGLSYLIEAMPKIIAELHDLCLIIAGEFWEGKESCLKRIDDLQIADRVKVINGYIPNEDVGTYFSAADIVVLPYISGTGSGIVQIAYGFGKPVIATKVGCLPEVVVHGQTGYLVEVMDSAGLANAVISFYKKKKENIFASNVASQKRRFSWDHMVSTIEAFGA